MVATVTHLIVTLIVTIQWQCYSSSHPDCYSGRAGWVLRERPTDRAGDTTGWRRNGQRWNGRSCIVWPVHLPSDAMATVVQGDGELTIVL